MATCPFCEYSGASSAVEAHISGKTDEEHEGKIGSNYRGLIQESIDKVAEAVPGSDDAGEGGDGDEDEEVARYPGGSFFEDHDAAPGGLEEIPASWVLVAMTVVFAVVVLSAGESGSESVSSDPDGYEAF